MERICSPEEVASKRCSACDTVKLLTEFHRHAKTADGHTNWCKPCLSASNKRWKVKNRDKVKADDASYARTHRESINAKVQERHRKAPQVRADGHRRRTYGLTVEEFEQMLKEQGGKCAICSQGGKLHVDHCHNSGKVRGLLCFSCNTGLGMFKDDILLIASASNYLLRKK